MCNVGNLLKGDIKGISTATIDVFLCLFLLVLNTFNTFISLFLSLNGYLPADVAKSILHKVHTLVGERQSRKKFNCAKFNFVQGRRRVNHHNFTRCFSVSFIIYLHHNFLSFFQIYVYLLHMHKLLYCTLIRESLFGLVIFQYHSCLHYDKRITFYK